MAEKDTKLNIRVRQADKDRWIAEAKRLNVTMTDWILMKLNGGLNND